MSTAALSTATLKMIATLPGDIHFSRFIQMEGNTHLVRSSDQIVNEYLHSAYMLLRNNKVIGRFALYVNPALMFKGHKAICMGAYACIDDDTVANVLLNHASNICKTMGYNHIIGPMHGSTWQQYRLSINSEESAFFLDVHNPSYYNNHFTKNRFIKIARYYSGIGNIIPFNTAHLERLAKHYEHRGAQIRILDIDNLEKELYRIAEFSNNAFANNFLFTPINKDLFVQQYLKLKHMLDPQLIWIVENQQNNIEAFLFAYKDPNAIEKTMIIKSTAVMENTAYRGIATFLYRKMCNKAHKENYKKLVTAFMHESNSSLTATKKSLCNYKEYGLYAKELC